MAELNTDEIGLIIDALNQYWNQAYNELKKKDLGDIERKNWEGIKSKCTQLMNKL